MNALSPSSKSTRLTVMQLWKVDCTGEDRKISYLSALVKHTQAVNVVRFSPKGSHNAPYLFEAFPSLTPPPQGKCWHRQEMMETFSCGCRRARRNWV